MWLNRILKRRRQVVILGIDGLSFSLAKKLAERGKPGFRALFAEGMAVPSMSSVPHVSCTAWTCAASGRNPAKHGVFGFIDFRPNSYDTYVPLATDVRCSRIWGVAGRHGKKVAIIGVPVTYPPEKVNGLCVSGFLAPSLSKAVHPPEYLSRLTAVGYCLDVDPRKGHDNKEEFLEQVENNLRCRTNAIVNCLRTDDPDLLFAHVIETDRLNHFMYDVIESEEGELAGRAMAVYDLVDDLIVRVMHSLPGGARLIVCSDHGFAPVRRIVQVNDVLSRLGWTAYDGPGHGDISPDARAFSLDPGRIYIHTSGRFPRGPIAEADRDRAAADLKAALAEELVDPDSGASIVNSILTRREAFDGPLLGLAPDLVIVPERGIDLKGALPGRGALSPGALVGVHTPDDALLAVIGGKITTQRANVTDVGPSALHCLGLCAESDTDGSAVVV